MRVIIKPVMEHYEIYINGKFYCSVDNLKELQEELATIQN